MEQSATQNINLIRGKKEYEAKIKNIEGILDKLNGVLDITNYKNVLEKITNQYKNNPNFNNKMVTENMQMTYEGFLYKEYSDKLDLLARKMEKEALPFYELYILNNKIESQLSQITGEIISDTISNTIRLINCINNINSHNEKDKEALINRSYKTIYSVILYEELFDRSDILKYINELNIPIIIENIGRLLSKDLDREELIDSDLEKIKTEGLGYDYLEENVIKAVSRKTVGEQNSEYQERKRQTINELSTKTTKIKNEKDRIVSKQEQNKTNLNSLKRRKTILVSKMLSLALIPVITISAGNALGKSTSNKITEYKTITRTINTNTGKVIGDTIETYDEHVTTYVATVLDQSPWRKNPTGVGFIRNVTAYEYILPENASETFHPTSDELKGNLQEKYKYVESKDQLDLTDSITESTILITETYQDKNDSRKSTKNIVPFTVVGACIGLAIDACVLLIRALGYEEAKRRLYNLNSQIKEEKLNEEEIKEELIKLRDYAIKVQNEYNNAVKKYGNLGEQFIFEEIDTKDITDFSRQLKRH